MGSFEHIVSVLLVFCDRKNYDIFVGSYIIGQTKKSLPEINVDWLAGECL